MSNSVVIEAVSIVNEIVSLSLGKTISLGTLKMLLEDCSVNEMVSELVEHAYLARHSQGDLWKAINVLNEQYYRTENKLEVTASDLDLPF